MLNHYEFDYIIDGPYLEAYRSLELRFAAVKTNRSLMLKKTLENKVISNENEL